MLSNEFIEDLGKVLSQRKLNIIKLRFIDGLSLKELSEIYCLSQARISQIIKEGLISLNEYILSA